jgi:2-dehydro-3-deoxyphosphogluconate aldolase/(4S)-4-hydroxy-2-oxoglutarate aldolase
MKNNCEIISTAIDEFRLIAILRGIPSEMLTQVLDALYEGGIRLAEITYDFTKKVSAEVTAENIRRAVIHTEGRMHIGAGTVTDIEQLKRTEAAGGKFIISPNTDTKIIEETKNLNLVSIPGAMTVSEICTAISSGADYVKLFPVSVLGPGFIKQVLAPLEGAKLLAVSGVTLENIPEYIDAGCAGFGIGGAIANRKLCESGKFDTIRESAEKFAKAASARRAF